MFSMHRYFTQSAQHVSSLHSLFVFCRLTNQCFSLCSAVCLSVFPLVCLSVMSAVLAEIKDIHNASTRLPYKMATEDERSCQNITV